MFGDDTDMWRENLFQDFILDHTDADGSDIGEKLTALFDYLDTPPSERTTAPAAFEGFRYVNGGIFKERLQLPTINAEFRAAVLDACDRDWKTISPAIFGSMFQSVRDAKTRRELGEHYTSEENILKTLNPLFLDELRAEFDHTKTLGKYEADRLRKLREKLGRIRYMDPACGCGNFIIVAYRELRDLELAIMERLQQITGDQAMLMANVGLKGTLVVTVKVDCGLGDKAGEVVPARSATAEVDSDVLALVTQIDANTRGRAVATHGSINWHVGPLFGGRRNRVTRNETRACGRRRGRRCGGVGGHRRRVRGAGRRGARSPLARRGGSDTVAAGQGRQKKRNKRQCGDATKVMHGLHYTASWAFRGD